MVTPHWNVYVSFEHFFLVANGIDAEPSSVAVAKKNESSLRRFE